VTYKRKDGVEFELSEVPGGADCYTNLKCLKCGENIVSHRDLQTKTAKEHKCKTMQ